MSQNAGGSETQKMSQSVQEEKPQPLSVGSVFKIQKSKATGLTSANNANVQSHSQNQIPFLIEKDFSKSPNRKKPLGEEPPSQNKNKMSENEN